MKSTKFKLERKTLLEVERVSKSLMLRSFSLISELDLNIDQNLIKVLVEYSSSMIRYTNEIQKLLASKQNYILIDKNQFSLIENIKKEIVSMEKELEHYPYISIKIH